MKYYKLTDRLNYNEIVKDDNGKRYTYQFGAEKWILSGIMTRYMWPDDKKFGEYVVVSEYEAEQLLDEQRKKLDRFVEVVCTATENAHTILTNKYGKLYEEYYKTIMNLLDCTEHKIVWCLYDVIERNLFSLEELDNLDISYRIINSVRILVKPDNISEEEYLASVKKDSNTWNVKKAELIYTVNNYDNLKSAHFVSLPLDSFQTELTKIQ